MEEFYRILIGIAVLILGFPIGNFLAKITKDEIKLGKFWIKIIIFLSGIGAIISLIFQNDALFFSFLFFMIIASRSLKR